MGSSSICFFKTWLALGSLQRGSSERKFFPSYARSDNFQAGQQWARMLDAARTSEMTKSPSPASAHPAQPQERMAARWKDGASAQAFCMSVSQDLCLA